VQLADILGLIQNSLSKNTILIKHLSYNIEKAKTNTFKESKMLLNFQTSQQHLSSTDIPVVLIHGLFGSLSNLGMLARALQEHYPVIQIDVT